MLSCLFHSGPATPGSDHPAASCRVDDLRLDHLNRETPLAAAAAALTPLDQFFVRSHFSVPELSESGYVLRVDGRVRDRLALTFEEIRERPQAHAIVTLECAGNGRALLDPRPHGTPWRLGAFGTARFGGTALGPLLLRAGPLPEARFVRFAGADQGEVAPGRTEPFARSVPIADALADGPLLAWEMDDLPLTAEHGFPLRSVLPGRYGVDSVKWLVRIEVGSEPFGGFFQDERYRYVGQDGLADGTPVARVRPRSLIARPAAGASVRAGRETPIAGSAWSGEGEIALVEVSVDGGRTWAQAQLTSASARHGPTLWRLPWTPTRAGRHRLVSRARDEAGNIQPPTAVWNELGYGNNAAHSIDVEVVE